MKVYWKQDQKLMEGASVLHSGKELSKTASERTHRESVSIKSDIETEGSGYCPTCSCLKQYERSGIKHGFLGFQVALGGGARASNSTTVHNAERPQSLEVGSGQYSVKSVRFPFGSPKDPGLSTF